MIRVQRRQNDREHVPAPHTNDGRYRDVNPAADSEPRHWQIADGDDGSARGSNVDLERHVDEQVSPARLDLNAIEESAPGDREGLCQAHVADIPLARNALGFQTSPVPPPDT